MASFTRKAIMDSCLRLLEERPVDKITVKDIVEDCGINRNTFYDHNLRRKCRYLHHQG